MLARRVEVVDEIVDLPDARVAAKEVLGRWPSDLEVRDELLNDLRHQLGVYVVHQRGRRLHVPVQAKVRGVYCSQEFCIRAGGEPLACTYLSVSCARAIAEVAAFARERPSMTTTTPP